MNESKTPRTDEKITRYGFGNSETVSSNFARKLETELNQVTAALSICRGQWIHSVNAPQCLAALGEKVPDLGTPPEEKCCGNCAQFKNEDINGNGWCAEYEGESDCGYVCSMWKGGAGC